MKQSEIYVITQTERAKYSGTAKLTIINLYSTFGKACKRLEEIAKQNEIKFDTVYKYDGCFSAHIAKLVGSDYSTIWCVVKIPLEQDINVPVPIFEPNDDIKEQLDRIEAALQIKEQDK